MKCESASNVTRASPMTSKCQLLVSVDDPFLIDFYRSRVSLAVCQEAKHSIIWMHLDEERGRLLTLGHDRVMKIWDLSPLLKSTEI